MDTSSPTVELALAACSKTRANTSQEPVVYRKSAGIVEAFVSGAFAGFITWHPDGTVAMVSVLERFRRRGIATELYRLASSEEKLTHSSRLTEDGERWIASLE
jgi:ribosomal protein S18 acetylase RimI-like enzyme